MLYSHNRNYPSHLPERIRLSDGRSRTNSSTYTEEEIIDAGYFAVSIPNYDPAIQELKWDGRVFTVQLIPPPLPESNWDQFNTQMLTDPDFNQVYDTAHAIAPVIVASLPAALIQVSDGKLSMFAVVWNQIMQLGNATAEMQIKWGNWAKNNNLPDEFIVIIKSYFTVI